MNETLVKYLAGLLDADGSLSFSFKQDKNRKERYFISLHLRITASDAVDKKGFVESLPEVSGMGNVSRYGDHKQFAVWSVGKRSSLEMLLPRLIKHMVIKAKHWQWLYDSWREIRGSTISFEERIALTASSKESRKLRVGPKKPKNHPTWAWLSGYIDGDGWYRNRYCSKSNYQSMSIGAVAHINDVSVLEFLKNSFGGSIREHGQSENCKVWVRNLGVRDSSFALRFLPNLAKHSKLKKHKIDAMIHHHRQRLSNPSPTG